MSSSDSAPSELQTRAPSVSAAPTDADNADASTAVGRQDERKTSVDVSHNNSRNNSDDGRNDDDEDGDDDDDDEDFDATEQREREMRMKKLTALLARSGIYSKIMSERMVKERAERAAAAAKAPVPLPPTESKSKTRAQRKRPHDTMHVSDYLNEEDLANASKEDKRPKRTKVSNDKAVEPDHKKDEAPRVSKAPLPAQPKLITGATLRDYQLEGVAWLISLYENGLNGILADEMGLGKTLQTISFLAHLREHKVWGPFLVVAPLSTIYNWETELQTFAPSIPALVYHGNGKERQELRRKHLTDPSTLPKRRQEEAKQNFPVVITSYEMIIRDRGPLSQLPWKYVVVDEGHRLKNFKSKLVTELKKFHMAQRLILTGTPLQNNLSELWSLLNFILPDIFDDLDTFEEWFDFHDVNNTSQVGQRRKKRNMNRMQTREVVSQLHAILKPFMLRRLKTEVERSLPPKQEYLLYTQLTPEQAKLYNAVIDGSLRNLLIQLKTGMSQEQVSKVMAYQGDPEFDGIAPEPKPAPKEDKPSAAPPVQKTLIERRRDTKRRGAFKQAMKQDYVLDAASDSDDSFEPESRQSERLREASAHRDVEPPPSGLFEYKEALQEVRALHLDNLLMQLRKMCDHPWLMHWPHDENNMLITKDIAKKSGKLQLLQRLLRALLKQNHRILIFSEFVIMMDILELWLEQELGVSPCRLDGTTTAMERRELMNAYNSSEGAGGGVFILSTRAGGLGINLASADSVIFYDSDWNPAVDAQAQDRAHRIGQINPVLVFRLAVANTIEQRILNSAQSKRRLEELVIADGRRLDHSSFDKTAAVRDFARLDDDPQYRELTDKQLEVLLDRSPEAMARPLGWTLGSALVTETRADGTSDEVARLMAEEEA